MKLPASTSQNGGFVMGMIVGLLLGLALALGVALYVTKVPIPFVNKVPQRTAEQDAAELEKNKNWDPNSALQGKGGSPASGSAGADPAGGSTTCFHDTPIPSGSSWKASGGASPPWSVDAIGPPLCQSSTKARS